MDKIEVGEYVRTIDGNIARLIKREIKDEDVKDGMLFDNYIYENHTYIRECCLKEKIKTHSKNKIDLIEVGDIIILKDKRKYEVLKISYSKSKGKHIHIINPLRMEGGKDIFAEDIKSILTHEQFESMKYNFEEE